MTKPLPVTLDDIRAAARTIEGQVVRTPTRHSQTLSLIAGCDIYLKFENWQFTASFKERGAYNRLTALTPEERKRGVAAMSAGNHAQGVAYHAGRLGIPATIVMPVTTPFVKVAATRSHGAEVVLEGQTVADAQARCEVIQQERGMILVHPYDPSIHDRLAALSTATARHADAVRERRAIVALKPVDRAAAHYNLALALEAAGDKAAGKTEVLKALEIAPGYAAAQELLLRLQAAR